MPKNPEQQPTAPPMPPIMYTEYEENFGKAEPALFASAVYEIVKYLEAMLGKCNSRDSILVINVSAVPRSFLDSQGEPPEGDLNNDGSV